MAYALRIEILKINRTSNLAINFSINIFQNHVRVFVIYIYFFVCFWIKIANLPPPPSQPAPHLAPPDSILAALAAAVATRLAFVSPTKY